MKTYNQAVIKRIMKKYGVTNRYVRECVSGRRPCEMADLMIKDYNKWVKAHDEAVEKALN